MFCFQWTTGKPKVVMKQTGTMITVLQYCRHCEGNPYTWRIQPYNPMFGRYPAVNVLLRLLTGAFVSKIIFVCHHMGLSLYTICTYFVHQKKFLFLAILHHCNDLKSTSHQLAEVNKRCTLEWYGRFDSIWHHAKYVAYTMVLWNNFENWLCLLFECMEFFQKVSLRPSCHTLVVHCCRTQ